MEATAGERRGLGHRPPLDGLRGIAFALVFLGHSNVQDVFAPAATAMFLFFALSGFLITALLLGELGATGRISLPRFFERRALRLLPALVLFLAVWLLVAALFGSRPWISSVPGTSPGRALGFPVALEGAAAALAYSSNWLGLTGLVHAWVPIGHLWSLNVEEQFYLSWAPLLFLLTRRTGDRDGARGRLLPAVIVTLGALSLLETVLFLAHGVSANRIYIAPDTRAAEFLTGALLAVAWSRGRLAWLGRPVAGAVAGGASVAALVAAAAVLKHPGWAGQPEAWIVSTVAGGLVVALVCERSDGWAARVLSGRVLTYLGRRSYALYLWHYPWLTWFRSLGTVGVLLALAGTLASAEVSWRLVEARAMAYARRSRPNTAAANRSADPGESPQKKAGSASSTSITAGLPSSSRTRSTRA